MLEAFIETAQCHDHLTVFPVISPHVPVLPYLLSTEIQASGVLTVREKGEGSPPMLLARNNSLHPILILGGEPLPGGDPGRLVERSILLGGKSVTQIPAPGIEKGGWVNEDREAEITQWLDHFPLLKNQVGLMAFLGERMVGFETLGAANLYTCLHRRILVRFIKEALQQPTTPGGSVSRLTSKAQGIVEGIGEADRVVTKRIGIGEYSVLSGRVTGGDLVYHGHLVHLSVVGARAEAPMSREVGGGDPCY